MLLSELTAFLDDLFKIGTTVGDLSNNGLQVEGTGEVKRALFAVDASLALFEFAAANKIDFIFVHHGISWGSEPKRLTGLTAKRINTLFNNGISLYAAHLPLDTDPIYGNNAGLAKLLGVQNLIPGCRCDGIDWGFHGEFERPLPLGEVIEKVKKSLGISECRYFGNLQTEINKTAILSGGSNGEIVQYASEKGCELLITGEVRHDMYHTILESGLNLIAAGHYATETVGPKAIMELIGEKFPISVQFADYPTGM